VVDKEREVVVKATAYEEGKAGRVTFFQATDI
jgi:hypothetical protein